MKRFCDHWYFLDKRFKFQQYVCNPCRDSLVMSIKLIDIDILNICDIDYRCNISENIKSGAVNVLGNADLHKGRGVL